jgi:predicted heme/steroid binding protein
MRAFTEAELSHYDGRDGRPAYIAYEGKVYDVSTSFQWRGGRHWVVHRAGRDLTAELAAAPHDSDLLERVPLIGFLIPAVGESEAA